MNLLMNQKKDIKMYLSEMKANKTNRSASINSFRSGIQLSQPIKQNDNFSNGNKPRAINHIYQPNSFQNLNNIPHKNENYNMNNFQNQNRNMSQNVPNYSQQMPKKFYGENRNTNMHQNSQHQRFYHEKIPNQMVNDPRYHHHDFQFQKSPPIVQNSQNYLFNQRKIQSQLVNQNKFQSQSSLSRIPFRRQDQKAMNIRSPNADRHHSPDQYSQRVDQPNFQSNQSIRGSNSSNSLSINNTARHQEQNQNILQRSSPNPNGHQFSQQNLYLNNFPSEKQSQDQRPIYQNLNNFSQIQRPLITQMMEQITEISSSDKNTPGKITELMKSVINSDQKVDLATPKSKLIESRVEHIYSARERPHYSLAESRNSAPQRIKLSKRESPTEKSQVLQKTQQKLRQSRLQTSVYSIGIHENFSATQTLPKPEVFKVNCVDKEILIQALVKFNRLQNMLDKILKDVGSIGQKLAQKNFHRQLIDPENKWSKYLQKRGQRMGMEGRSKMDESFIDKIKEVQKSIGGLDVEEIEI